MIRRIIFSAFLFITACNWQSAIARNERVPPPRTYISSGGFGDAEPWLPSDDDPGGGGNYGGGYDGGLPGDEGGSSSGDGNGDGGIRNWWNDGEFWGWGSGWWRYPDPLPPSGGGEGGDGDSGCEQPPITDRATSCMVQIETGAYHSICSCAVLYDNATDKPIDCGTCYPDPATGGSCWWQSSGDECSN